MDTAESICYFGIGQLASSCYCIKFNSDLVAIGLKRVKWNDKRWTEIYVSFPLQIEWSGLSARKVRDKCPNVKYILELSRVQMERVQRCVGLALTSRKVIRNGATQTQRNDVTYRINKR